MIIPKITTMAVAVPKKKIDLLSLGIDADEQIIRTAKLTGVNSVRYAPKDTTSVDYCMAAAEQVLNKSSIDRNNIDGVIFATPHPDYIYPGNCSIIQDKLGLPKRCFATDINHSCTGLIYGLHIADRLVKIGDCKNVLVCCGDTASHHLNKKDRALRTVVGDGGAAVLVTGNGISENHYMFHHDGSGLEFLYTPAGGERMPLHPGVTDVESTDAEGNVRSLEDEYMDGMAVMKYVMTQVPILITEVLKKQGWKQDDVDVFSFHQANAFMIKSLARAMKIKKENFITDVDGFGNIGGASLALALCDIANKTGVKWNKAVFAGFGTGMSGTAMTADISKTQFLPVLEI